jgi:pyruvate dehydrogenase E1 component
MLHPEEGRQEAFVTSQLKGSTGPVVAVSDFMRAVQDQIAPWVEGEFISLGTDGFGLSDTRGALRRHFRVDGESIAVAALYELNRLGEVDISVVKSALDKYAIHDVSAADPGNTEGSG